MILLPIPKNVTEREGALLLSGHTMLVLSPSCPEGASVYAELLKEELRTWSGFLVSVTRGAAEKGDIILSVDPSLGADVYTLSIDGDGAHIAGGSLRSMGWGVQTLRQIVRQSAGMLPFVTIEDEPEIKNRGFYHDTARGRVQTLENLKKMVDILSFYKMTEFQLYIEHTYLFRGIPELWRHETPLTAEEILELDRYAYERGVELVPSLSSFGHLCNLLSTKTYQDLCELPGSNDCFKKPFSYYNRMNHHTMNVSDPRSLELAKALIGEYMQLFRTDKFNICADETFDLGQGRSRALAEEKGKGTLYLEYICGLFEYLVEKGKRPMFWGDIICHYPELLGKLPKEVVCLNWGYGEEQRDTESRILAGAGATQYICPGVRSWNCWVTDIWNGYRNITRMCGFGRKFGAIGVLNTDWGDFGHINHPVFSVPGLIYGAVFSWSDVQTGFEELNRQISVLEFGDPSGELVGTLAEIYPQTVFGWHNVVTIKEWTQEGRPREEIRKRFLEEDMTRTASANARLCELEKKLQRIVRGMDSRGRRICAVTQNAIEIIRTWNETGSYLASMDAAAPALPEAQPAAGSEAKPAPALPEAQPAAVSEAKAAPTLPQAQPSAVSEAKPAPALPEAQPAPTPSGNGMELADRLERAFWTYQAVWRENSKEGDIQRIADIFYWYADLLRDDYRTKCGNSIGNYNK